MLSGGKGPAGPDKQRVSVGVFIFPGAFAFMTYFVTIIRISTDLRHDFYAELDLRRVASR